MVTLQTHIKRWKNHRRSELTDGIPYLFDYFSMSTGEYFEWRVRGAQKPWPTLDALQYV